jgi:transposase InsO family protein
MSRTSIGMESLALRSQIALYQRVNINKKQPKPRPDVLFRLLWVFLFRHLENWKSLLSVVKPDTVIGWHRAGFKVFWCWKSRKPRMKQGRPPISDETIKIIKQIHKENPILSPEKIHEQLVNLSITDAPAPNTIAKYIPNTRKPPSDKQIQSWKTFLHNHNVWSMDFFVIPTIRFKVLYVLIIISHKRRRIEHFAVTDHPNTNWLIQQLRNATPFGKQPKYLLHDNDPVFKSKCFQTFLANSNIKSVSTAFRSPWQNGICERTVSILRQELLDHIIPINQYHLTRLLNEYVGMYYNPHRTHQGIGCQTPDVSPRPPETMLADTVLESSRILGGLYHTYIKCS